MSMYGDGVDVRIIDAECLLHEREFAVLQAKLQLVRLQEAVRIQRAVVKRIKMEVREEKKRKKPRLYGGK